MDAVIALIFIIGITVALFIFGRELICWYFKINQRVELLESIRDELRKKL